MRTFPVLRDRKTRADVPRSVPWAFVEPHAARIKLNHYQTMQRMSERGGLSAVEFWFVLSDVHWGDYGTGAAYKHPWPTEDQAADLLLERLRAFEAASAEPSE